MVKLPFSWNLEPQLHKLVRTMVQLLTISYKLCIKFGALKKYSSTKQNDIDEQKYRQIIY